MRLSNSVCLHDKTKTAETKIVKIAAPATATQLVSFPLPQISISLCSLEIYLTSGYVLSLHPFSKRVAIDPAN